MLGRFDITALPSPPYLLLKLLTVFSQEDASIEDIAQWVRLDYALSAKVIALASCRAPLTAGRQGVLLPALQSLGVEEVRWLTLNAAFSVSDMKISARDEEVRQLWRHAVHTALLAQALSVKAAYAERQEAYLAGLLHDIGRNALWANSPADYANVQTGAEDESALLARESRLLGINHAEAGAAIVHTWGLRSFLEDALRYHHEPAPRLNNAHPLIRIVAVAQHLADLDVDTAPDAQVLGLLNLTSADARNTIQSAAAGLRETEQLLGMSPELDSEPMQQTPGDSERRGHRADPERSMPSLQKLADQRVREQLAVCVRDMVLLDALKNRMLAAPDNAGWRQSIRQGLQAIFDLQAVILFLPQGRGGILRGLDDLPGNLAGQILIPPDDPHSFLALSLRRAQTAHTLQPGAQPLTVLDEQVIRLTGKRAMLCLPLQDNGAPLGLIVCGMEAEDMARIDARLPLLARFAREAARTLRQKQPVRTATLPAPVEHAREILHEVNNPLNIVRNYLNILGAKLPQEDPAHADLRIITDEIERIASLLKSLLGAPEKNPQTIVPVDINRVILELIGVLKPALLAPGQVQVETLLAPDLPQLITDAGQIQQVLHNLIKNAAEAMPAGGKLRVASRRLQRGADVWVELRIEDTGPGIPAAVREKLFQPVTTTKGGNHAGLGLSIVQSLVKGLGGIIECETRPSGTTFVVQLPAQGNVKLPG